MGVLAPGFTCRIEREELLWREGPGIDLSPAAFDKHRAGHWQLEWALALRIPVSVADTGVAFEVHSSREEEWSIPSVGGDLYVERVPAWLACPAEDKRLLAPVKDTIDVGDHVLSQRVGCRHPSAERDYRRNQPRPLGQKRACRQECDGRGNAPGGLPRAGYALLQGAHKVPRAASLC
jgi:hypothetical protein